MRDDRVLLPTRIVSIGIIPVLSAAFVILYLFPSRTEDLWAWTMAGTMAPMVMGGGYLSGAYFFYRAATVKQWHRVGIGFLGVTVFATLLGITTLVHWDRFNHGHVSFWAWAFLYFVTPVLLPWLWYENRKTDPHTLEPGDRVVPKSLRVVIATFGALLLAFAAVMFFRPTAIIGHTPWPMTPLVCRSLSAYVAFPAVAYLWFAFEDRWSSFQILIEVALIGYVFIGIAGIRAWDEFSGSSTIVWAWRIGILLGFGFLLAVRLVMARPPRATERSASAGRPVPAA
ncbi:MAG: hypothetical protein ACRD12_03580 [Acidimicrobiales bacterium]